MLKGFAPLIAKEPKILILGSMPSVTSLEKQEYYGFAHNRFWKIMSHMFSMPIETYEQKKNIIMQHHMIVWDVIKECEREGSLDSAIRNELINPIDELFLQYPSIKKIICNGRKSYDLYQRYFSNVKIACSYLPSTSNANRTIKETALFAQWEKEIRNELQRVDS